MNYVDSMDRIYNIGISQGLAASIKDHVLKWYKSCGPEWTVGRLKEMKLFFIHLLSGHEYKPETWIALKNNGLPKGPFGSLMHRYMKKPEKVFHVLAIYTDFVSPKVTEKQCRKFFSTVEREKSPSIHIDLLKDATISVQSLLSPLKPFSVVDYNFNEKKFSPNIKGKSIPSSMDCLFEDFQNSRLWDFLDMDDIEGIIADSLGKYYVRLRKVEEDDDDSNDMNYCVGKISVIQEPGFKARFIANPCMIYQIVLHPLGDVIFDLIRRLPWDCTHDQQAGTTWVSEQIRNGSVCHSVDLSDATNNFPFEIQKKVLEWLDIEDCDPYIKLFELVSKGLWYVPLHLRTYLPKSRITWTNGQPLGLYPSFAVFALTHGLILRSFEMKYNVSNTFRVLGDDVVISNEDIYKEYISLLRLLQVPVSESKSISSRYIAEFAGSIIGSNFTIIVNKWRTPTDERRLSLISSLPTKLDLTNSDEFVSSIVRSTPLGGNKNNEGLSLKSRIPFYYSFWKKEEEDKDIERLSLSSEMSLYYKSRFCQDFKTLPLIKRSDIDDFIKSILMSYNYKNSSEIYQHHNNHLSQDSVINLWFYLLETFNFPIVDCPKQVVEALLSGKRSFTFLIKSLNQVYNDEIKSKPISYFKRRFVKSVIKWEKLPENTKLDLIKIIALKFMED